jgi:hypothetical protein
MQSETTMIDPNRFRLRISVITRTVHYLPNLSFYRPRYGGLSPLIGSAQPECNHMVPYGKVGDIHNGVHAAFAHDRISDVSQRSSRQSRDDAQPPYWTGLQRGVVRAPARDQSVYRCDYVSNATLLPAHLARENGFTHMLFEVRPVNGQ